MFETMVKTFDGTELRMRKDTAPQANAAVVIAHGLCEHLNRYDDVAAQLVRGGFSVYRYDQRGHGKSGGKPVYLNDFNELADDANFFVEMAQSENPDLPVFILGHSMGGETVALFLTKYPGKVKGAILVGALTRYSKPSLGELPIQAPADHYLPNQLGGGVCSDPAVVEAYANDPLVPKEFSVGIINQLYRGVEYLRENPQRLVDAVLILHGFADGLVPESDSRILFEEIASTDKELHIYAKLFHEILNEPCRGEIVAEVMSWLNKHLA